MYDYSPLLNAAPQSQALNAAPQSQATPESMLHLTFRFNQNQPAHLNEHTLRHVFRLHPPIQQAPAAEEVRLAFRFNPQEQQAPIAEPVRLAFRFQPQPQSQPVALIDLPREPVNHYPLPLIVKPELADFDYEAPPSKRVQVKHSSQITYKSDLERQKIAAKSRAPIEITYANNTPAYTITGCVKPVDGSEPGQNNCIIPDNTSWIIE